MLVEVAADEATRTEPAAGVEGDVAIRKRLRGCSARDLIVTARETRARGLVAQRGVCWVGVGVSDGTREGAIARSRRG